MTTNVCGVEIRRLQAPLGAEVYNLDATQPVAPEIILALKQAHREHHILIFKNQDRAARPF